MFDGLGIIGLFAGAKQIVKEGTAKKIPAEYFNNRNLMYKDQIDPNVTPQEIQKNIECGKYYSPTVIHERIENPLHKIVDVERYEHDVREYGQDIADENVKCGMYSYML